MPIPRDVTDRDIRRWRGSILLYARLTPSRAAAVRLKRIAGNPCLLSRHVFPSLWLEEQLSAHGCGEGETRRRRHLLMVRSIGHPDPWALAAGILDDYRAARQNAPKVRHFDA